MDLAIWTDPSAVAAHVDLPAVLLAAWLSAGHFVFGWVAIAAKAQLNLQGGGRCGIIHGKEVGSASLHGLVGPSTIDRC